MIRVSLNDQTEEFAEPLALQTAMEQWGYDCQKCAVAINGEFVPRGRYQEVMLDDGDEVDVVAPVGGG